jgi:catalase
LQLPINRPKTHVATNQRGGQMEYYVDGVEAGENPHVNYEPSSYDALREAKRPDGVVDHTPYVAGNVVRQTISRQNNFKQAGERYRSFEDWERDELIKNLVGGLSRCNKDIQDRMIGYFTEADADYGRRVAEGIRMAAETQEPAQTM